MTGFKETAVPYTTLSLASEKIENHNKKEYNEWLNEEC